MMDFGKEAFVKNHPNEWREVPGYSAYAVNRCGDLVDFNGRVEAKIMPGGRLQYVLEQKWQPRLVCTPSDLIVRAFRLNFDDVRQYDYVERVEKPVFNEGASKVTTMEIVVMPPNGPGRIFRGQKPETVVEVIDAVKYGRGFLLEDFESDTAFTYAPGTAALVQTKVEK